MQNSYPFKFSEAHYVSIMPGAEPFEETFTGTVKLAVDEDDTSGILTLERNGVSIDVSKLTYSMEALNFEAICIQRARDLDWAKNGMPVNH